MVKRISISLDREQVLLLNSIKGFGSKEAEKVKAILLAYFSEKGYIKEFNHKKWRKKAKQVKPVRGEKEKLNEWEKVELRRKKQLEGPLKNEELWRKRK